MLDLSNAQSYLDPDSYIGWPKFFADIDLSHRHYICIGIYIIGKCSFTALMKSLVKFPASDTLSNVLSALSLAGIYNATWNKLTSVLTTAAQQSEWWAQWWLQQGLKRFYPLQQSWSYSLSWADRLLNRRWATRTKASVWATGKYSFKKII